MDFYARMRVVCLAIPEGKVATYGQIALLCGAPNNARQVGFGLRRNLAGGDVPAHRVVNGRGELSGAHRFEFPGLQQALLQQEGVHAVWNGRSWRVNLKEYGWQNSLQEAQQFARLFDGKDR